MVRLISIVTQCARLSRRHSAWIKIPSCFAGSLVIGIPAAYRGRMPLHHICCETAVSIHPAFGSLPHHRSPGAFAADIT